MESLAKAHHFLAEYRLQPLVQSDILPRWAALQSYAHFFHAPFCIELSFFTVYVQRGARDWTCILISFLAHMFLYLVRTSILQRL
jgi:hypothetical protein